MNHEQATEWIFDLHAGRLDAAFGAEVADHAGACDRCRRVLTVYDAVTAALRATPSEGDSHADVESLVAWVMEPETLGSEKRSRLEQHLARCASCTRELEAVRAAEAEHASALPVAAKTRAPVAVWSSLAAGVALAALGAAAYAWLWQIPRAEMRIARLEQAAAADSPGAVALPLFRGAVRAGDEETIIAVGPGAGSVPLAVAPDLPREMADTAIQRFEIRDGSQRVVFSVELTAGEIRRLAAGSDVLALLVPEQALSAGSHVLRMIDQSTETLLLEQAFRVVMREEEAGGVNKR